MYLINRIPTPILDNKSPYEGLYKKKPNYSYIRVFGSLCYASTLEKTRDKFTPRAIPHVFIGYSPGVKGYKILNLQTNKISISRNVQFHEHVFPFHTTNIDYYPDFLSDSIIPSPSLPDATAFNPASIPSPVMEPEQQQTVTKSNRVSKHPTYLQDYICAHSSSISHTTSQYSIASTLAYTNISPTWQSCYWL